MMKYMFGVAPLALVLALAGCDSAPAQLDTTAALQSETVDALDGYEAFTLDNGLDVILMRDASDPVVAITTVIHAGSNREEPGRTGFAHFFEHMAFNDSENVPVGANRRDIPAWGGSRNGYTTRDRTVYYETVPVDAFDKLLWIDSDRLGYMINTVTDAALEREKQVVKNEKRQRVDNAPYGYAREIIPAALYPADHPYNWPVIGSLPDLQAARLEDVREFYDRYYGAGNATLAIVGDIDLAETRNKVEYWFGEIRPGPEVNAPEPQLVELEATKRIMLEDNFAKLPELRMTWPIPQDFHEDELALTLLGNYLGGSKDSALYRILVEEDGLAPSVSAYASMQQIAGEFVIRIRAEAGTDLDRVKASVERALAEFATNGLDDDDLKRITTSWETGIYSNLSTALGKSQSLAINSEFAGDPAYALKQADAVREVSVDDVRAVFAKWIEGRPHIVTSIVPAGEAELAVDGSDVAEVYVEEVRDDVASEEVGQGEEAVYERTQTVADRSEPAFGDLPLATTPPIFKASLPGGAELSGINSDETPLVEFYVTFDGGNLVDADDQAGLTSLLTRVMNRGSALRTPAEIDKATGLLGSSFSVGSTDEQVYIYGSTLARNLEPTLAIIEEVMTQPRFTEDNLETARDAALTRIRGGQANPNTVAAQTLSRLLHGDHPAGRPGLGYEATVAELTLEDLQARFADLSQGGMAVHVVGAVDEDRAVEAFSPLSEALATDTVAPDTIVVGMPDLGAHVYFVDVPGSKQSIIRAGRLTVPSTDPEHYLIDFANETLGGSIGADLAQTLRIEKGYTYGAYSGVGGGRLAQPWTVRTSVRANATGPSLDIIRDMIGGFGENFDDDRSERARNKTIKDSAREQESLNAKLGILSSQALFGRSDRPIEDRQDALLAMTTDDFRRVATDWFDPAEMTWVVVGDGATQRETVRAFAGTLPGGTFAELTPEGDPVEDY